MALGKCGVQNKLTYPSKTAAIRAALSYSKKRGHALRVYRHSACGGYHLTSQSKVDIHTGGAA